jgi:hypothetical protein
VGVNWIQAVEFSKWRTDRVNEAILEKIFEKGAKTNDVSESSFSTETYLKAPTMTYGGDEEIVLKGGAKKSVKAGKDGKVVEQKMFMHSVHQVLFCQNTDSYRSRMGICSCS